MWRCNLEDVNPDYDAKRKKYERYKEAEKPASA
jgi:hypothetical protein